MTAEERKLLEKLVLKAIDEGYSRFRRILSSVALQRKQYPGQLQGELYRPVDRSLQRLRKAGTIRFTMSGWYRDSFDEEND